MAALNTSLRALKHPLTLTSIGLLLLNDHVLKASTPSVLTGKLSDFAGLFFFPFLLAFVLSALLAWRRVPARPISALAFGLTLAWFTAIKTLPVANTLTAAAASHLLGLPVRIALDPTDLLALVVLWPAWRLWRRLERAPTFQVPGRLAYLALGAASLAALATSPCMPPERVERLAMFDDKIYAHLSASYAEELNLAVSSDGLHWERIDAEAAPEEILPAIQQAAALPAAACEPGNPQVCYRTGAETVERSTDGGQTWRTAWRVPWGRRQFMEMYLERQMLGCKNTADTGPYDLVLLPQAGGITVVAAMGNEGVLTRTPAGDWQRVSVMSAEPTPFAADASDNLLFLLLGETGVTLAAGMLLWIGFSIWGGGRLLAQAGLPNGRLPQGRSVGWATAPAKWGIGLLIAGLVAAWSFVFGPGSNLGLGGLLGLAAVLSIFIGPILTWRRVSALAPQPDLARKTAWVCTLLSLGVFPVAGLAFVAWAYGVIPAYGIALGFAVLVGIASPVLSVRVIRRAAAQMIPSLGDLPAETPVAAAPAGQPSLRKQAIILCGLAIAMTLFLPMPAFILDLVVRFVRPGSWVSEWRSGFWPPLPTRIGLGMGFFILPGLLGLWLARRVSLPGLYGRRAADLTAWLRPLLVGAVVGAVFVGAGSLLGLERFVLRQLEGEGWLIPLPGALGEEIFFRLFGLSLLAYVLSRLWPGERAAGIKVWVAIVGAALICALVGFPLTTIMRGSLPIAYKQAFVLRAAFDFTVGLLAGRQYHRDGLAGAVCINLGASLGWEIFSLFGLL
jgi:hypothetical protein